MFGERLKQLRSDAGYTQQTMLEAIIKSLIDGGETEKEAQISIGTYRNWEQNVSIPNSRYLRVIAPLLSTTTDFLLGVSDQPSDYSRYGLNPVTKHKIPLLGSVACGKPIYAEEDIETYIDPGDVGADFALHAEGDSMIGDGIMDGYIVFVRKQAAVNPGEIAVVLLGDKATLKHVYKTNTELQLVASNPAYAPIIIREDDDVDVTILGKAVGIYHEI